MHAIGLLRSKELRGNPYLHRDLIQLLHELLRERANGEGSEALLADAVRSLGRPSREVRERAQIVLAAARQVPDSLIAPLGQSDDLFLEAWSTWWATSGPASTQVVSSDSELFDVGVRSGADPVAQLADLVRERVEPLDVPNLKDEFVEGRRTVFRPNLQRLADWFEPRHRLWVDLDGDGVEEFVAFADIPDGWEGQRLTLIAERVDGGETWALRRLRWWDTGELNRRRTAAPFLVLDLDGDGDAELVEQSGSVYPTLRVYEDATSEPQEFFGRRAWLVRLPRSGTACLVQGAPFNEAYSGRAWSLTTHLGEHLSAVAWTAEGQVEFEVIARSLY